MDKATEKFITAAKKIHGDTYDYSKTVYKGVHSKVLITCPRHGDFEQTANTHKRGGKCRKCSYEERGQAKSMDTAEAIKLFGKVHGNRYIYDKVKYKRSHDLVTIICKEHGEFRQTPNTHLAGSGCPKCGIEKNTDRQRLRLSDLQLLATRKDGKCLATEYKNARIPIPWECKKGHRWKAAASTIRGGTWCPVCAHKRGAKKRLKKDGLELAIEIAKERQGKLLSNNYKGFNKPLVWKCSAGHKFKSKLAEVQRGSWCPECASGTSERLCKVVLETIFNAKFPKSYPDWLRTMDGRQLELDGYAKSLGVAFEHQGMQHYKDIPHFSQSRSFEAQQEADRVKRHLCKSNGVALIEVPAIGVLTPLDKLPDVLAAECKRLSITSARDPHEVRIPYHKAYSPVNLEALQDAAGKHSGRLISKRFSGWKHKYLWECKEGHQWKSEGSSVVHGGTWCPYCRGTKKKTISDMRLLAEQLGGKCLSGKYKGTHQKLRWECNKRHKFNAAPTNVISGHWCPECAGQKRSTIEEMKRMAEERGGECLSDVYVNGKTKLEWKCAKRHRWMALPSNVKNKGSWCPFCAGKRKEDR